MLPNWRQLDNFRQDPHQRIVDAINRIDPFASDGDLEVVNGKNVLPFLNRQSPPVPIKIRVLLDAPGMYLVTIGRWKGTISEKNAPSKPEDLFDFPKVTDAAAFLLTDITSSGHSLAVDDIEFAVFQPVVTDKNHLVLEILLGDGGSLPSGQYQGMFYGMLTNNRAGFSFIFAVPATL